VTDINGCIVTSEPVLITEPPALAASLVAGEVSCHGAADGQIYAQVSGGVPAYGVQWAVSPPVTDSILDGLPAGTYRAVITDRNGCRLEAEATVTQPTPLEVEVRVTEAYCDLPNGTAIAGPAGGTPPYTFRWDTEPPQTGGTATGLEAGVYAVRVQDSRGCGVETVALVSAEAPPVAAFTATGLSSGAELLLSRATVSFENQSQAADEYVWDFGDGSLWSTGRSPTHTYREAGVYTVILTAIGPYPQCPDTATFSLVVIPDGALFLPNAFTPNGDGHNERFIVPGLGYQDAELTLYDRWGRVLFRTQDLQTGWDGTLPGGQPAPEGVYAFRLTATLNDGTRLQQDGTVTLIR
jgi:gliding motility-associated-like protein